MIFKKKLLQFFLYIFLLNILIFLIQFSTNKVYSKTYKIENIEVVEPYDLNFNKLEVIDKAFNKGFFELINKLILSEDLNKIEGENIKTIKNFVDSFSIVDEKFADNRYFAKFEVQFIKREILDYLENKNIYPSSPIVKKTFILPIFLDLEKNDISLFSKNIFYKSWNNTKEKYFLLEYILPNEDIEDIKILQNTINNIENYDFKEIVSKYNLNDYIISIIFKENENIRILSKVNLNDNLSILNKSYKNIKLNDPTAEIIIKDLKLSYENQWKKINQINTSIKLSLLLSIDSKNLNLINKFENKILELDFISNYYIQNFSSDKTVYKIVYNSTPDKFLSEFRSDGFEIDTSYKIWKIK